MILGTGIDVVDIDRFIGWRDWNPKQLNRIFHNNEIDYCLQEPAKSAERFAARFAAKEALYKALRVAFADNDLPFLTMCRNSKVAGKPPQFIVEPEIQGFLGKGVFKIHLSISHSKSIAFATVIIESVRF